MQARAEPDVDGRQLGSTEIASTDIEVLWSYLAEERPPTRGDAVFAFGSANLGVPRTAARLYHDGVAPLVLVTGGPAAAGAAAEADVYTSVLVDAGVPSDRIIAEREARNTGENVALGMAALAAQGFDVRRVTLVAFPTTLRRCLATFARQFPHVDASACAAFPTVHHYEAQPARVIETLLAELDRIDDYPRLGYFSAQRRPPEVDAAASRLRTAWSAACSTAHAADS